MIKKPEGYDNSPVYGTGDFKPISPGGHICQIRAAKEETVNGTRQLVIAFDIAADDAQAGYYQRQYGQRLKNDVNAKWPGVYHQGIDGKSTPFFKGLITSIERSNPGYTWNWDENTLKGKLFGGVFGRRQFQKTDGSLGWVVEIFSTRSIDNVLDAQIPDDKLLNAQSPSGTSAYGYTAQQPSGGSDVSGQYSELPF